MAPRRAPLFPLFLDLDGRRCVAIGQSDELREKCRRLLECGAQVTAIAPVFGAEWTSLADEGGLVLERRPLREGDLCGARLAISDSGDRALDERLAAEARREGVLLNVVDVAELCDYYSAAVVRRGPLVVAIGSSGTSPALVGAVRRLLEAQLPAALAELAEAVAARRDALRSRFPRFASRARRMRHVLENWWSELPRGSSPSGFAERVEEVLQCERSCDSLESCCQHRPLSGG